MTALDDLFTKTQKPNGNTIWEPKADVMVVPTAHIKQDMSDKEFYKKMYAIDPNAAKQFMDSRLTCLKDKIIKMREEVKQLEEYMEPTEDKIVSQYYKKVKNVGESGGIKHHITEYMKQNIGVDLKADHVLTHFKSKGLKNWSKATISQAMNKMSKMKEITNPYRGYYRMDA